MIFFLKVGILGGDNTYMSVTICGLFLKRYSFHMLGKCLSIFCLNVEAHKVLQCVFYDVCSISIFLVH
jgi:hypothetical protein